MAFDSILCKLFLSLTFLKLSVAVDTLLPNQTIGADQTLVSENQIFEVGIFRPGESPNRYLGIWYKSTPDIVPWAANRNSPITNSEAVTFGVLLNRKLALTGDGTVIWSANASVAASSPFLRLLDTGNLVVGDNKTEGYIWQSFDYPTDTWLPGMKMEVVVESHGGADKFFTSWRSPDDPSPGDFVYRIENQGLPAQVIRNGTTKMFRTGKWNGRYLNGSPRFPNAVYKVEMDIKEGKSISMVRPYESSVFTRATLDASGKVSRYTMNANKDDWNFVYRIPDEQCRKYGFCGPYGICKDYQAQKYECLTGFEPSSKNGWELQDYSGVLINMIRRKKRS